MEPQLNPIFNQEFKIRLSKFKELHLLKLEGATRIFLEEDSTYLYTFIFKDLTEISKGEIPLHRRRDQDKYDFLSRKTNRDSRLYEFAHTILEEEPKNVRIYDITCSIIQLTFTI